MRPAAVLVTPGSLRAGAVVPLDDDEAHHLHVRRKGAAEAVVAFDSCGVSAAGELVQHREGLAVRVETVTAHAAPPTTILAVGAGDRERFLVLAEKCTELGVTHLVPLETAHTVNVATRLRANAVEKARRRVREACKQCGNPWATVIDDIGTFYELVPRYPGVRWLLADADGGNVPRFGAEESIGWCVGPEGGFTPIELEIARKLLAPAAVRLGAFVLRFETAAITAAALTMDHRRRVPGEG